MYANTLTVASFANGKRNRVAAHLAVESLEVARGAQEDVLVGLEYLAVHDDTDVAENAVLPLLIELPEELTVVRGDLHVLLPVVHLCS